MKKIYIYISILIFTLQANAEEYRFQFAADASVAGLHDVSLIELQFVKPVENAFDDEVVSLMLLNYTGISYEALTDWEESSLLKVSFSLDSGGVVVNESTGARFEVIGEGVAGLIELTRQQCFKEGHPAFICNQKIYDAWDAELNRAYKNLGGSKNTLLRDSQRAWLVFFEHEKEFLKEYYSDKEGSFGEFQYMARVAELLEARVKQLHSVFIW